MRSSYQLRVDSEISVGRAENEEHCRDDDNWGQRELAHTEVHNDLGFSAREAQVIHQTDD